MPTVLIVDDEAPQRSIVSDILKSAGYEVLAAASAAEALQMLRQYPVQVALTDLKMPGKSGLTLIEEIRRLDDPPETVLVTAYGSIETAVKAMKLARTITCPSRWSAKSCCWWWNGPRRSRRCGPSVAPCAPRQDSGCCRGWWPNPSQCGGSWPCCPRSPAAIPPS